MISTCNELDIKELVSEAKLVQLTITKGIELFKYELDGNAIGVCGLVQKGDTAIFKFEYVKPQNRGNGILSEMINYRIALLKSRGVKTINVNAMPMSMNVHIKHGAIVLQTYKYGGKKLRYENL
jgi:N-acetylglutamate synthase-like GNAT family acetyltransferase